MKLSTTIIASMVLGALAADFKYKRLDREKAVLAVVDHQVGLLHLVRDMDPTVLKNNIIAHATMAKAFELPVVVTTSAETGPNGPTMAEITKMFPSVTVIPRPGQVNAWDNEDFRNAIAATNRSQVIIGGIATDVCTAFAALSMTEAGYEVFANGEASGTTTELARELANARMRDAGVQILTSYAVFGELMRDWRTPPTGVEVWPFADMAFSSAGFIGRSHGAAVEKGVIMPGQELLPW
ncbi:hypothetical protein RB594_004773 [Gaeumannomyces avenae]